MTALTAYQADVTSLVAENRSLLEELSQCQADKDFVWSLWKKVQDTSPDISEAISIVLQRERENTELKDRKILEILQTKDEKIEELQDILSSRSQEIRDTDSRRFDMQDDIQQLHKEVNLLRDKNFALEFQIKTKEDKEKNTDSVQTKTVNELEKEKQVLQQKVQILSKECDILKVEKSDEVTIRLNMESKVKILEQDVTKKICKFDDIIRELEDTKQLLQEYEAQVQQQHKEIEFKNAELENVRKELSELWSSHSQLTEHSTQQAELIRQLQSLQLDTQKILKNQEDAYTMENTSLQQLYSELTSKYEQSKKSETDLRQQLHNSKKELISKDSVISDLQSKLDITRSKAMSNGGHGGSFLSDKMEIHDPVIDLEFTIQNQQKELDYLKNRIFEKDRLIEKLEKEKCNLERQKDVSFEFDIGRLSEERTTSTPARETRSIALSPIKCAGYKTRPRSMSPTHTNQDLKKQLLNAERRLDDAKTKNKHKTQQLDELKRAHEKRMERVKTVQSNYKKALEQIKSMEEEFYGANKKKSKQRHDPRDLRREDSDAVWNELAHFKSENRNLMVERLALEEELDTLRVQSTSDLATIYELRVDQEQEEEDRKLEKKQHDRESQKNLDLDSEITLLRSEMQNKDIIVEKLEKDLRKVAANRDCIMDDKKNLRAEIVTLKQSSAQHRIQTADMKREIQRLRRDREEASNTSKLITTSLLNSRKNSFKQGGRGGQRKRKCDIAKQYQKCLNTSIENMQSVFNNFEDDGWEEITESGDEETNNESDSLGQAIASVSQQTMVSDTGSSSLGVRFHRVRPRSKPLNQRVHGKRNGLKNFHHGLTRPSRRVILSRERTQDYTSSSSADIARRVVLREIGTSPMTSPEREMSPPKASQAESYKLAAQSRSLRQLKPMRQRLQSMQTQMTAIKESRTSAANCLKAEREANQQLQSDLNLSSQRLQMSRRNVQKLTSDVEKLQKEKSELEGQLSSRTMPASPFVTDKHTEQDWKVLEARLKVSTNEITRQSATMRQLKMDNDTSQEQIRNLNDKINSLERDNKQKRLLLEEQKTKMKHIQENAKTDANILEELQTRIKLITDVNEKNKTQIESLKKRLSVVTREKRDYEHRFLKLTADIEKKTKQLMDTHSKKMDLESALSELEKIAQQQLQGLANHSEAAIGAAQEKLIDAHNHIQQYQHFIKTLGHELILKLQHTRSLIRETQMQRDKIHSPVNASLQRAQKLAKDILNLSQSDIDEIMSADGDVEQEPDKGMEKKQDKKWSKKCERFVNEKIDFGIPLVQLFMEKVDEHSELLSKLYRS